jgi:hypothetical protein
MTLISTITHLAAGFSGVLLTLWTFAKRLRITRTLEATMGKNVFVSILDHIGAGLKFLFANPVAEKLEAGGLTVLGTIWPGLTPLTSKIAKALANAATQVSAPLTGETLTQVIGIAAEDIEADLAAAGITETPQQQAVVAAFANFIGLIPSAPAMAAPATPAAPATASPASAAPVAAAQVVSAAAPTPAAQSAPVAATTEAEQVAQPGPGLDKTVAA